MRNTAKAAARWGLVVLTGGALALGACGGDGGSGGPKQDTGADVEDSGKDATGDEESPDDVTEGDEGPEPDVAVPDADEPDADEPDATEPDADEDATAADVAVPDAEGDEGGSGDAEGDGGDVVTPPCGGGCDEGHVCMDGFCIAECGDDVEAVRAALSDDWVMVKAHCRISLGSLAFEVLPYGRVLELVAVESGDETVLSLHEWNMGVGPVETAVLAEHKVPGKMSAWEVFPSYFVATDPEFHAAFFGYTLADFSGHVVRVDLMQHPHPTTTVSAPGNYDVVALDANTILVNGVGAAGNDAGQGIYRVQWGDGGPSATKVVTNLGFASGHVTVNGDLMVVGGYADPWPSCEDPSQDTDLAGGKVFAMSLSTVLEGAGVEAPVDAWCATSELAIPSDFRFSVGAKLVGLNPWNDPPTPVTLYTVGVDDDGYVITDTSPVALDGTFQTARPFYGTEHLVLTTENAFIQVAPKSTIGGF